MIVIGHRGARGHAPENTIASVERAIALGADAVEIDVHLVEGRLVVMHDDRVDRTTTGTGRLSAMRFAEVRALDCGGGQRVPTLDEVLDVAEGRAGVNVELKGPGTAAPVAETLDRRRHAPAWADRLLVSSFDHRRLLEVRARAPGLAVGALLTARPSGGAARLPRRTARPSGGAAFAAELGAYSIHPARELADEALVADAHARGLFVFPFTVDDPAEIERMRAIGADGLFTDYPDRARSLAPRLGRFPLTPAAT